ncbi:MAG: hypothetical protein ACE5J3_08785 [Methanosarcinales archaeon]
MLADSSSLKNLQRLELDFFVEDLEIVTQIKEEIGETKVKEVHEVSKDEVDALIRYLEQISIQTDKSISMELEKTKEGNTIRTSILCYYGKKGKISLHYGEFYLMARAVKHSEE